MNISGNCESFYFFYWIWEIEMKFVLIFWKFKGVFFYLFDDVVGIIVI